MVIEVGRLWRCLVLLEVTSMSSVLLSLTLSIFNKPRLTAAFRARWITSLMAECLGYRPALNLHDGGLHDT